MDQSLSNTTSNIVNKDRRRRPKTNKPLTFNNLTPKFVGLRLDFKKTEVLSLETNKKFENIDSRRRLEKCQIVIS
jgi:hypothetical protein